MTHLRRVLCAVDLDDRGRQVFATALAMVKADPMASLRVLHAASPEVAFNRDGGGRSAFFDELRATARAVDVELQVTVQRGDPAEIVLLHAHAKQPDVIVIGASAASQRRGLLGWTAEKVLRDAPCPTLVVPYLAPASADAALDSIVCAVDFSGPSLAAAREAVSLAGGDRHVTLLHVVQGPTPHQRFYYGWRSGDGYYRDQRTVAADKLRFLIPPPLRRHLSARVIVGDPIADIVIAAREAGASMLIIGAGGRGRLGSRLFGRTAALLREAPCPVLAVPEQASDRTHTIAA